jgi:hypothetical protein
MERLKLVSPSEALSMAVSPDFVTSVTIDEAFEAEANRLGSTRHHAGGNELVDGCGQIVRDSGHHLRHAQSIAKCNASYAPLPCRVTVVSRSTNNTTRGGSVNMLLNNLSQVASLRGSFDRTQSQLVWPGS